MYKFDCADATSKCIEWIRQFFEKNGPTCNAVLGISGGKDSTVAAALCVEALGKDRVIGVLLPNGVQEDIDDAYAVCNHLGIKYYEINIKDMVDSAHRVLEEQIDVSEQTKINLKPRLRMSMIYAVSQSFNGRVVNTCNLSEDWVGYSTRYGDSVGDFSPLSHFTVTEVKQIGAYLKLPMFLVNKVPSDGLCGQTDEGRLGFTYEVLDKYIRENIEPDVETKKRIDHLHKINQFKLELMPSFKYYQN